MFYILDNFSLDKIDTIATVKFIKLQQHEARAIFNDIIDVWEVKNETSYTSAIKDSNKATFVSSILYNYIQTGNPEVELKVGDRGLIFLTDFKVDEFKVFDTLIIQRLLEEKKALIYYFEVMP